MANPPPTWRKKALWFIALWLGGVAALALIALALRLFMRALGLAPA